ncbi:prolyl aminopeptidase [Limosilactobacillus coleohominis DSM 14060]|nr:prolyl aminopeptidase [Limosilactobacillus coleohominis DSM 14060]
MLVHQSPEMPWNYLRVFSDFARQNDVEIIMVELTGSYLSDQNEMASLSARVAEIQAAVAAYQLDHFVIHGIGDATTITRQYVQDHPRVHRLITTSNDSAKVRATEILGDFANPDYLNLIRAQMRVMVVA